jgi:hypothetical protein
MKPPVFSNDRNAPLMGKISRASDARAFARAIFC